MSKNQKNTHEQFKENHKINMKGVTERRCTACNEWKEETPENFYYKSKQKPEKGFLPECKICSKARSLKTRNNNLERSRRTKQEWYRREGNAEQVKEYNREYYEENPEKKLQTAKAFRQNNKEIIRGYSKNKSQNGTHKITIKEWKSCKEYFNNQCAYCGLPIGEHYGINMYGERKLFDFHKEHVVHHGSNGLDNCICSCGECNSEKNIFSLDDWYNENNIKYSKDRYNKIQMWLNEEYKNYIIVKEENT